MAGALVRGEADLLDVLGGDRHSFPFEPAGYVEACTFPGATGIVAVTSICAKSTKIPTRPVGGWPGQNPNRVRPIPVNANYWRTARSSSPLSRRRSDGTKIRPRHHWIAARRCDGGLPHSVTGA